jgi:hypothetical protein
VFVCVECEWNLNSVSSYDVQIFENVLGFGPLPIKPTSICLRT